MKKLLSLTLIVLLFLTAGCKKALEQDETGALLPPEVSGEQSENIDETQDQPTLDAPTSEIDEEQADDNKTVEKQEQPEVDKNSGKEQKVLFNDGKNRAGTPISFKDLPTSIGGCPNYMPIKHLSEIQENYSLDRYIVFQGVKEGLSTPIEAYEELKDVYFPSHFETDIRVSKVYYGDVQIGDVITCLEHIRLYEKDGKRTLSMYEDIEPIAEDEEYLFILSKSGQKTSKGTDLYGTISLHYSYHKLSDFETYKATVQNGTAGTLVNFGYEVLDYYLNQPQTKLDLREEALKYVENIPEDATEEEILQALPEDKKELFDRMIDQYGTITSATNETVENVIS